MHLRNPLSRLRKTISKYDFELTIQNLRMKENGNPSKELVYIEVSRGSKRFKTAKAFVSTGEIAWDDTFQLSATLYKTVERETNEASFDKKEFAISFLEYSHVKHKPPRLLCRCRLNIAEFACEDVRELSTTCQMVDKQNQPFAILAVLVKCHWIGDFKIQKGATILIRSKDQAVDETDRDPPDAENCSVSSTSTLHSRSTAPSTVNSAVSGHHPPSAGVGLLATLSGTDSHDFGSAEGTRGEKHLHFLQSLRPMCNVASSLDLDELVACSPGHSSQSPADDARVVEYALTQLPHWERFTPDSGLPVAALMLARYALEVRSSRFTSTLGEALTSSLVGARHDQPELAHCVSCAATLVTLCALDDASSERGRGRFNRPQQPVHPTSQPPEVPSRFSAAQRSEHERRVALVLHRQLLEHLAAALRLFLRETEVALAPLLSPAFLEQGLPLPPPPARAQPAPGASSSHAHAAAVVDERASALRGRPGQLRVVSGLHDALDALHASHTPLPVVQHAAKCLARFVSAQLFNTLLRRAELCTASNGLNLKLGISALEAWVESAAARCEPDHAKPVRGSQPRTGAATASAARASAAAAGEAARGSSSLGSWQAVLEAFASVRQAADVLSVDKAALLSEADRRQVCPTLHHSQVAQLLYMFQPDEWASQQPGAEEISAIVESVRLAANEQPAGAELADGGQVAVPVQYLDPYAADAIPVRELRTALLGWEHRGLPLGPLADRPALRFLQEFDMSFFKPTSISEGKDEQDGDVGLNAPNGGSDSERGTAQEPRTGGVAMRNNSSESSLDSTDDSRD